MSWHFLAEAEEASWEGSSLDGAPDALLRLIPAQGGYFSPDRGTESLNPSPSGTTSPTSMEGLGKGTSISLQVDFPAKMSALADSAQGLKESGADCGVTWPESFAKWDRDTSSWRTHQYSLLGGLEPYSETWPQWGSMLDGECLAHAPVVVQWNASGFGLPAPTKSMGERGWGISNSGRARYSEELQANARLFGYKPHPSVLEWSMGWTPTWTRLVPLETAKFQQWFDSHGISSPPRSDTPALPRTSG
jgi:hypothetical protein